MTPITSLREEAEPSRIDRAFHFAVDVQADNHAAAAKALRSAADAAERGVLFGAGIGKGYDYGITKIVTPSHPEYRSSGERGEADALGTLPQFNERHSDCVYCHGHCAHPADCDRAAGVKGIDGPRHGPVADGSQTPNDAAAIPCAKAGSNDGVLGPGDQTFSHQTPMTPKAPT